MIIGLLRSRAALALLSLAASSGACMAATLPAYFACDGRATYNEIDTIPTPKTVDIKGMALVFIGVKAKDEIQVDEDSGVVNSTRFAITAVPASLSARHFVFTGSTTKFGAVTGRFNRFNGDVRITAPGASPPSPVYTSPVWELTATCRPVQPLLP